MKPYLKPFLNLVSQHEYSVMSTLDGDSLWISSWHVLVIPWTSFILRRKWSMLYSAWYRRGCEVTQYHSEVDSPHTIRRLGKSAYWPSIDGQTKLSPVETIYLSPVHNLAPGSQELIVWFLLRCLKFPLDSLSRTSCWLTESHLTSLSQSPNIKSAKGPGSDWCHHDWL